MKKKIHWSHRFIREYVAIYRCLIRRFSRAHETRNVRKRTEHRKAEINSVASSINANSTPAISRNVGTKGHNARAKKKQREFDRSINHPFAERSLVSILHAGCIL